MGIAWMGYLKVEFWVVSFVFNANRFFNCIIYSKVLIRVLTRQQKKAINH
jgi:hypothetical protein